MKITKELLKKLVREAFEEEMGSEEGTSESSKKLSKQAVKHLEYDHINVDYDTYKDAAPGHVIEMVRDGDPVPKSFIASDEPPEDFESDEDAYIHADLGVGEFWVGTYDGDQKTFSKTGESLDGYFVVEYYGTGWRYVDGPFSSEEEAKQKGIDIANKRGMTTYDEIGSSKEGSKEEDEGMLKESVKRRFARLANIKHKK